MTYTETQIEAIKLFGRKDLNQGCLLQITLPSGKSIQFHLMEWYDKDVEYKSFDVPVFGKMQLVTDTELTYNKSIEILGHIPNLFPDVAQALQAKGYTLELLKIDTIESVIKISRFDMKRPIKIPYRKLIPILDQPSLPEIISLFK